VPRLIYVDHDWITNLIPPRSRVLDLGCGDGTLLARLQREKEVKGTGIDISPACVQSCIEKGLPTIEGDIDEGLQDYPDAAFDFVVLCRTLHLVKRPLWVLAEALRVGKRVILSFENEAYWRKRLRFLWKGDLPADGGTSDIPAATHPKNFLTVAKLEKLIGAQAIEVEQKIYSSKFTKGKIGRKPNFRAKIALYQLRCEHNAIKGKNNCQFERYSTNEARLPR
jgi:methionine biosynthesis protein MetW